jgi:hypothetical protein
VFVPVEPLASGPHELRLVESTPDREIIERGFWTFEVRSSARFRESALAADLSLTGSQRIADRGVSDSPARGQASGSLTLDGHVADDGWRVSGYLPLIYDSNEENLGGDNFSVADFLVTGDAGPVTAKVGHQLVPGDNLLFEQSYSRRGIAAAVKTETWSSELTGFAVRGSPVSGFVDGLGVGDSDNRVLGLNWSAFPMSGEDGVIKLSAAYLQGSTPANGSSVGSVAGDSTVLEGDVWGVTADSQFFSSRLRLRGDYAHTDSEFADLDLGSEGADAYAGLLTFDVVQGAAVAGKTMDWRIGTDYGHYGTFFFSVADPGGVRDSESVRAFSTLSWGGLSLDAVYGQESDNVDDQPLLPTTRKDVAWLSGNYAPTTRFDQDGNPVTGWYGQPTFGVSISRDDTHTTSLPLPSIQEPVDTVTDTVDLSVNFGYPRWNWGAGYSIIWIDDKTNLGIDTQTDSFRLDAGFQLFSGRLGLTPSLQYDRTEEPDSGFNEENLLGQLNTRFVLVPDKWGGNLDVNANYLTNSDDSVDSTTYTVSGGLDWIVSAKREQRPGVSVSLEGLYQYTDDDVDPANSGTDYQIFLKATVGWSALY